MSGPAKSPDTRPTSVKVTAHRTAEDAQKQPYTVYVLLIEWEPGTVWTVEHRFSEFENLRSKLSDNVQHLPSLPGKTWLRSFSADFIEKRRQQLHSWVQHLLTNEYVIRSKEFRSFLEVDANVSQTIDQQATEIKSFTDPQFGVNDFVYDESYGIILTACEDVHMLSRLDSKLSNWKLPWEKQAGCIVPIGSFSCWRLDSTGEFKPSCTLYFDCQVSVVAWDPARRYAMIGLESGNIIFYFVDTTFSEFTVVQELDHHKDRVTGLIYNATRDILISCSRDKRCVVYDMKQDKIVSEGVCSKAWISSMAYDEKTHRVFLGTYAQTVVIYSLLENPPTLLHTLSGHSGSVRCLSYRPRERYLFSGGFDANAGIWSIEPTEIRRSRNVGWLSGGPQKKIKSVVFCPSLRQVITGMDGGSLAVWDTTNGKLKHVIKAGDGAICGLHWLDDVHVLITASHDGKIKFWKWPTDTLAASSTGTSTIDLSSHTTAPSEEKSNAMMHEDDDDPEVKQYREQQAKAEQAQLKLAESKERPKGSSHQITAPQFEPESSTQSSFKSMQLTSTSTPRGISTTQPTTSTTTSTTSVSSLREPDAESTNQRQDPVEIVGEEEGDMF